MLSPSGRVSRYDVRAEPRLARKLLNAGQATVCKEIDMKSKWIVLPVVAAMLTFSANAVSFAQTAKQDMKDAGTDTKNAVKNTGHGIAKGTKTAARKTKNGTETAARKTKNGTKKVVHKAAHGTAKTADKVENKTTPN